MGSLLLLWVVVAVAAAATLGVIAWRRRHVRDEQLQEALRETAPIPERRAPGIETAPPLLVMPLSGSTPTALDTATAQQDAMANRRRHQRRSLVDRRAEAPRPIHLP